MAYKRKRTSKRTTRKPLSKSEFSKLSSTSKRKLSALVKTKKRR